MKPIWQSKTFWAALLTGLIGTYKAAFVPQGYPDIPDWVLVVLGALGIYGRATATKAVTLWGKSLASTSSFTDDRHDRLE